MAAGGRFFFDNRALVWYEDLWGRVVWTCGDLDRLWMAEILLGAVVLRIIAGSCPRGCKQHGMRARSGRYGVLAKTSYASESKE